MTKEVLQEDIPYQYAYKFWKISLVIKGTGQKVIAIIYDILGMGKCNCEEKWIAGSM